MTFMTRASMQTAFRRRVAGFTLFELMITVAVVAILATIAMPAYQDSVRKSRRAQAKADLVELAQNLERYHTVQNTYATAKLQFTQSPREGTAHYTLSFDKDPTASTFGIQAVPVAGGSQAKDTCGTLALDQAGRKKPTEKTVSGCW